MEGYGVRCSDKAARRRLEEVGFDRAQAEELVHMISGNQEALATKQDLAAVEGALKQEITDLRTDLSDLATTVAKNTTRIEALERAMDALRQEVRDRFESFRKEIAGQMDGLRGEMDGLRGEMNGLRGELRAIKWLMGGILAILAPLCGGFIALALR